MTPFAAILRRTVEQTPHAIGGAFADSDGEMVDSFSRMDAHEWAVITAHYGVVLAQLKDAFGTLHFGSPEYFVAKHSHIEIHVHAVGGGYYALVALSQPVPLDLTAALRRCAVALAREMD